MNSSVIIRPCFSEKIFAAGSSFASDGVFSLEIDSGTLSSDLLAVSGTINLGSGIASLFVNDLGSAVLGNGTTFTFNTGTGLTGEFAGLSDGAFLLAGVNQYEIDYGSDSVSLIVVPEPGSAILLLGGMGVLAFRRRRNAA